MPISRQADSRANQKARTRAALVDAAAELLRGGSRPTVAEAADAARVSRATAYRYFPTQESLLVEVSQLSPAVRPVQQALDEMKSGNPEERLVTLLETFVPIVLAEEATMRMALRVYLDTWLANRGKAGKTGTGAPVREGRRMRWLDQALAPVRSELTPRQWRRLRAALALTLSVDAVVVLKDVCRIEDDREIVDVLRWAALALLRAGRQKEQPSRSRRGAS